MMRKLFGTAVVAALLTLPSAAAAAVIAPIDLNVWFTATGLTAADIFAGPLTDPFTPAKPPPEAMGSLTSTVFFDSDTSLYTYVHVVSPTIDNISEFNTEFAVEGFTGTAGWKFTGTNSAQSAGMTATPSAFVISQESDGGIDWEGVFLPGESLWDSGEAITFFFVSTLPPHAGDYNLINGEAGTATTFAPIPEPGSMALIGAGLLGLAGAIRRRRGRLS